MAWPWWRRGLRWVGAGVLAIVALLVGAVALLTQSAYGRERVRQIVVQVVNRSLLASLQLGALRFGPGCALAIDSVVLRDPDDSLLVSLGPTRATCRFGALVHGRVAITSLEVAEPLVVLRQSPAGVWNWSRVRPRALTPPPPRTGPDSSPARVIVDGTVRLSGGTVTLEVPGQPERRVTSIAVDLPRLRTEVGDTTLVARLASLSFALSEPALRLRRLAGDVAILGKTARIELPVIALDQSAARVSGEIGWGTPGAPAIHARIHVDTLALGDLAAFSPRIPPAGGGHFEIAIHSAGGSTATDFALTNLDVRTMRSAVRGAVRLALDRSGTVSIRDASLDLAPLHTDLLRLVAGEALPATLRGALTAHMSGRGTSGDRIHLDSVDARFTADGGSATGSRIIGRGVVVLTERMPAVDLRLEARPIAPAALARSFPALSGIPSLSGRIAVRGNQNDASLLADLRADTGSLWIDGRYRRAASGLAIKATARLRDVDAGTLARGADLPAARISSDIAADLAGKTLNTIQGTAVVSRLSGTVAGLRIEPSHARLALTDSRIIAESVLIVTSAGTVHARGAMGRYSGVNDTLFVNATASLAELAQALPDAGRRDTNAAPAAPTRAQPAADTVSGTVTARARVMGSVESFDVDADVEGTHLVLPVARGARAHATADIQGAPRDPRGRVTLRIDSVVAGATRLATLTAAASTDSAHRWRIALGTAPQDRPGGAALGAVSVRGDTLDVQLDSLAVRIAGADLRLVRPARLRRAPDRTLVVDSVELRGSRGTLFRLAGVYRDTGAIAASLHLSDLPIVAPGPPGLGDSLRALARLAIDVEGSAGAPRGTLQAYVHVLNGDSLGIDSLVATASHTGGRTRLMAGAFHGPRTLLDAEVVLPVDLALAPFKAAVREEPLSGDISIDSLSLQSLTSGLTSVRASAGTLRTKLRLAGTPRRPRAVGNVTLRGAAAAVGALGLEFHGAEAVIDLAEDGVRIREATVRAGRNPEGRAELSGEVGLGDGARLDLRLRAAGMPVIRVPERAELDVSGDLRLIGPNTRPALSGRVTVDRGTIRLPDMGRAGVVGVDDSAFVRLLDSLAARPVTRPRASIFERLEIGDLRVTMGPAVWLRSAEADVQLGGSVGLTHVPPQVGAPAFPVALRGSLVTQRGTYRLNVGGLTRAFHLDEGSVEFTGEPRLNPKLDINATYAREGTEDVRTAGTTLRVRAHVGGTLERPRLTLSSTDSSLSQAELMSYLVTGRANFAAGDVSGEMVTDELVASATGAVAQRLAGGFFDVVDVTAGTTDASRDADEESTAAEALAASRIGFGKQLSDRLFMRLDAGLCALVGNETSTDLTQTFGVSLDYRFRPGLRGSVSSAPSTNGASCANQATGRGTALSPRQWGLDLNRVWRF